MFFSFGVTSVEANYIDLHVSKKIFLVVALLKKKKLFIVAFPVHFSLNVFIFLIKASFLKTHCIDCIELISFLRSFSR